MKAILEAWRGEASLARVFWGYGVGMQLGVMFLLNKLASFGVPMMVCTALYAVYGIWLVVSIWRCAKNSSGLWKVLARLVVVFQVALIVATVAMMNGLLGHKVQAYVTCAQAVKQEGLRRGVHPKLFLKQHPEMLDACVKEELAEVEAKEKAQPGYVKYRAMCEKVLTDAAKKHGYDAKTYIDQNQKYLKTCIDYYVQYQAKRKPQ